MRNVVLSILAVCTFAVTSAVAQEPVPQNEVSMFGRLQSATSDLTDNTVLVGAGYAYVGAPTRFITFGVGADAALSVDENVDENVDLRVKLLSRLNLSQNLQVALGAGYVREGFLTSGDNGLVASAGLRLRANSGVGVFADYAIEHFDTSADSHFPFTGNGFDRYSVSFGLTTAF